MKPSCAATDRCRFNYWSLVALAGACLVLAIAAGVACSVATVVPGLFGGALTLRELRPAHTMFSLAWILAGPAAVIGLIGVRHGRPSLGLSRAQLGLFIAFLAGAVVTMVAGRGSGREYVTWPPAVTLVLAGALALTPVTLGRNWRPLRARSPEAAWLVLTGSILLPLGLLEESLHRVLPLAIDPGRDLAVQWHALDTVIASWSMVLYGIGILVTGPRGRPLRARWLFVLAAIGIVADFGHHNYASPQAHVIKLVSFSATMLAVVSFVRHVAGVRRAPAGDGAPDGAAVTLRHIEAWTLFAVGSGVLLAVPVINLYTHGTYVIVAHTMGAMAGINSLLLLLAGFRLSGVAWPAWRTRAVRATSAGLAVFCLVLTGLGVARGVLRVDHDFQQWQAWLRPWRLLLVVAAIPFTLGILILAVDFLRCCRHAVRPLPADAPALGGSRAVDSPPHSTTPVGVRVATPTITVPVPE